MNTPTISLTLFARDPETGVEIWVQPGDEFGGVSRGWFAREYPGGPLREIRDGQVSRTIEEGTKITGLLLAPTAGRVA